jgi:hypothetical protein
MNNCSLNGEDIILLPEKQYYVIDALFLNDIRLGMGNVRFDKFDQDVEAKIFPHTVAPFAKFRFHENRFSISSIKKFLLLDTSSIENTVFSSDTGLILIIEESIMELFVTIFNYDDLVDSIHEIVNIDYWKDLTSSYPLGFIGLIIAPGIGSGYEFEGSGIYKIDTNTIPAHTESFTKNNRW